MRRHTFGLSLGFVYSLTLLLLGAAVFTAALSRPASVLAQEEAAAPADAAPADAEPAPAAAAPAATNDTVDDTASEEAPSYLAWAFKALGVSYSTVFLGLSFTLVALFVMNLLMARRENVCPVALIESFDEHLNEQRYQDAFELAKSDDSFLGQVLAAGLSKISKGYSHAVEAMQEVGEEENMKMEHRLSYMALIGTISPMVGLLGTVQGMIAAFSVIASSASAPKPSLLAEGISTALFTTLVGLVIAIPAIAAYNILKNRIARLVLEVGINSENLMSRFEGQAPAVK